MNKPLLNVTRATPYKARYGNFIGGAWVEPVAGRYFSNTSPVNGAVLCDIPRSDADDIELPSTPPTPPRTPGAAPAPPPAPTC